MSHYLPQSKPQSLGVFARLAQGLRYLQSIEIGPKRETKTTRIGLAQQAQVLRLLLMLLENGLSLPRALASLSADHSLKRYRELLRHMRNIIETGGSLSEAMAHYPRTFTAMQVQQVRMGERSGALEKALRQVCDQVERKVALRKRIIKKTSYPLLITVAGTGLMVFMCTFVVPEFENVYADSGVDLPVVTQVVTEVSRSLITWGWVIVPVLIVAGICWKMAYARPVAAKRVDSFLLHLPIFGSWLRDAAVLQFTEGVCSMVECGYTPVDAVKAAAECVRNRSVRAAIEEVKRGVQRGERLSNELMKHDRFFPATMCQLVGIGEQSGDFEKAISGTSHHLRERLETRLDAMVGLLEPVLTILLAVAIGAIVLSIYMPMFHMFEVLE